MFVAVICFGLRANIRGLTRRMKARVWPRSIRAEQVTRFREVRHGCPRNASRVTMFPDDATSRAFASGSVPSFRAVTRIEKTPRVLGLVDAYSSSIALHGLSPLGGPEGNGCHDQPVKLSNMPGASAVTTAAHDPSEFM